MHTRLTRNQIKERYPRQWVGLTDVEWEPDNDSTVKSAVVAFTDLPKSDLVLMQTRSNGSIIAEYTTPEIIEPGFMMVGTVG